jgi:DNA repair exonuclease SbcCD ATPase subunit
MEMAVTEMKALAGQVPDAVAARIRTLNEVLNSLWGADDCSAIAQVIGARRLDAIFEAQNSLFAMLAAAPQRTGPPAPFTGIKPNCGRPLRRAGGRPMAKTPTPMLDPAGSPGNMQDVSDLQQMLAQTQAELEAAREQIGRMKAEVAGIMQANTSLRDEIEDIQGELDDAQRESSRLENELEHAERLIGELEEKDLDNEDIRDLATARRVIRGGDISNGVYELERVLDRSFDSWRIFA